MNIEAKLKEIVATPMSSGEKIEALSGFLAGELSSSVPAGSHSIYLVAFARENLGRALFSAGQVSEALVCFMAAESDIRQALADDSLQRQERRKLAALLAAILQNHSFAALENRDMQESQKTGCEAVSVAREYLRDAPQAVASALSGLSAVYYRLADYDKAFSLCMEAKTNFEQCGNSEKAATCMNNLGRICEETGRGEEGIAWHEQAVNARRRLACREDLAFSLGNLGVAYAQNGRWRQARESLAECVEIYGQLGLNESRECAGYVKNLEICDQYLRDNDE